MTIPEKLRRLMKTSNKSAVARSAGLTPNTIFFILSGKFEPSISSARALAGVLGVQLGWLLDDSQGWDDIVRVPPVERVPSPPDSPRSAAA